MAINFVPLNANRHRHLKLIQPQGYRYAREFGQSDLLLAEFGRASAHYPIVFASHTSGTVRPIALLSRDGESNAFISSEGRWLSSYVPMVIRLHPFAIARVPEREAPVVCVDMNSELLSYDSGAPLFDINGDRAPVLDQTLEQLNEVDQMLRVTQDFCQLLQELGLLVPLTPQDQDFGMMPCVDDCYRVDDQAFDQLSDAGLRVLRQQGWLAPLYAHRISLMRLGHLPVPEITRDFRSQALQKNQR